MQKGRTEMMRGAILGDGARTSHAGRRKLPTPAAKAEASLAPASAPSLLEAFAVGVPARVTPMGPGLKAL